MSTAREIACAGFLKERDRITFEGSMAIYQQQTFGDVSFRKVVGWNMDRVHELPEVLNGLMEIFLKKDCLDLPDRLFQEVQTPISKEQIETVPYFMENTERASALQIKLRQLSDGIYYTKTYNEETGREDTKTEYIHSGKDDLLRDHLDEFRGTKRLVIGVAFKGTLQKVTDLCIDKGWSVLQISGDGWKYFTEKDGRVTVDRSKATTDFAKEEMNAAINTGTIENLVVVSQVDAGSMGLEFSASPTIIFYSSSDNGGSRMQFEDRNHSNNSNLVTDKVTIIDYICLPIDKLVLTRLRDKKDMKKVTMKDIEQSMIEIL